jgi:diguanylate cyclase (GGDEF)-like protein
MVPALLRPDPVSFAAHLAVTLLFAGLFAFLYRESRQVYFQYWALGWFLLFAALLMRLGGFPLAAGLLQLAFAVSLIFAGSAVVQAEVRLSTPALAIPAAGAALYAGADLGNWPGAATAHSLLLLGIYGWNYIASRRFWRAGSGSGGKIFCLALAAGALLAFHDALVAAAAELRPPAPLPGHLRYHDLYYLVFETLLAFSAMMMWMEAQNNELRLANRELAESRKQLAHTAETDPLTGLLNRISLNQTCEANQPVTGVVAVLDLDNFKDINDALGHLTGDEVLASVGNLIRSSFRKSDHAWRWGGDEFVILFQDQTRASAEERLQSLEEHLERFRIRGRGALPIHLSWGIAEVVQGSLSEAIERADRRMYLKKKEKATQPKFFRA